MSKKNIKCIKRLPLGNAEFKSVRTENYFYVDKTRYIELLEQEPAKSQLFIRPRRFGKSLFLSTLSYYYDVNSAEDFEQLFGDLYIGNNPTPKRNSYAVMRFDFSGINTSCGADAFILSFCENIRNTIRQFLNQYKNIFPKAEQIIDQINNESPGIAQLEWAFSITQSADMKIFVIIDEYDNFASGLIRLGFVEGEDFYTSMVKNNGIVRSFYATIKKSVKNAIIDRTFITGISPVLLDDFTSGYNIIENFSLDAKYNEMLGFTREEVETLKNATGVDDKLIKIDIEYYYNGYLFNKKCKNKMYNPSMILYLFNQILKTGEPPERLIDPNLGMDTTRLEPFTKTEHNRNILIKILTDGNIVSTIEEQFSLEKLNWDDESYFVSLLFYMG
ncbi:MAG: AAA family ATPase, partial [Planctomycetaceae bacterium]|nr:AAA family ATPase [Planctomycetaceae bacterium]